MDAALFAAGVLVGAILPTLLCAQVVRGAMSSLVDTNTVLIGAMRGARRVETQSQGQERSVSFVAPRPAEPPRDPLPEPETHEGLPDLGTIWRAVGDR